MKELESSFNFSLLLLIISRVSPGASFPSGVFCFSFGGELFASFWVAGRV